MSTDPLASITDLRARREDAATVPAPGEPEITMFMDDDRIIFRDQRALSTYVAAAVLALADNDADVSAVADAICVSASGWPDHHGAWTGEARAALDALAELIGGDDA
jgi:hypothetical protein